MSRIGDLVWCALSAPVFLPSYCLVTFAILCLDGRPILFRQERIGQDRRSFSIFKFRSMRDGRVTRIGAWLRRTGIDETAQWLNVLRGDMSWIGPRPLTPADISRLGWDRPEHDPRFRIRPGITGLAQLLAGIGSNWTRGVDRLYRQRQGLRLHAWIIVWSIAITLLGKTRGRRLLYQSRQRRKRGQLTERPLPTDIRPVPGEAR